ncbi:ATP-grasp domain-containing protein [Paenibacillus oenotherae]|uniref:ATP-grasp domain-containing protein n=1 Tax=Paenibacillus oenotherae TaxID=1435645 RepID=A0ABS7DBT8_9BACL|nr:ATP-grasp domain-containing protein [Paenibacillus oenotherae]MBW7477208.1 ATP-grasp domain-containing protein [Paenibacillus oenotherae]
MIINGDQKRVLLTGGRAPATLELARLLGQERHRIYVAECLPKHLCLGSRYVERCFDIPSPAADEEGFVERLAAIIREEKIDCLIPTCEEAFYIAKAYERLSACCTVFVSPIAVMRTLHSKWEFNALLRRSGFQAPDSWLIGQESELHRVLGDIDPEAREKWVMKPEFSRFSSKVEIFTGRPPLPLRMKEGESWVLQRFVEGRQICTFAVASEGRMGAYSAYSSEFTAGKGACISFTFEPDPNVMEWMERFVKLAGYTGLIALDLIVGKDGRIHPIECNPRLTSGIHLFTAADGIGRAIFRSSDEVITPKGNHSSMIALAMLLYGLPQIRSPRGIFRWLHKLLTSRDVLFRFKDPLPFLGQMGVYGTIWRISRRLNISPLEASTIDIEWNGEL